MLHYYTPKPKKNQEFLKNSFPRSIMKFADFYTSFLFIVHNDHARSENHSPSPLIYINKMMKTLEKFSVRYTLFIIV